MSDARFILFQGTITDGDFLILPKPLASSENQAEIHASHANDDYSVDVYFNRNTAIRVRAGTKNSHPVDFLQ